MATEYCTQSDLIDERLGEDKLAELSNYEAQEADESGDYPVLTSRVSAAIRDASTTIDSYIRGVASLPVSDATALEFLKGIALDMAVYFLYQRYGLDTESIKAVYDAAMKRLRDIADGKIKLPSESSSSPVAPSYSANARRFTIDSTDDLL